jgi:hypothetical protein
MDSIASTADVEILSLKDCRLPIADCRLPTDDRRPTTDIDSNKGWIIRIQDVHLVVAGRRIISIHAAQSTTSRGRSDDRKDEPYIIALQERVFSLCSCMQTLHNQSMHNFTFNIAYAL